MLKNRFFHYFLLIAIMGLLTLPNLGTAAFWDVDEGVNAEAAREMLEAGTLLTPLFNFELRTAKPVMLYWLQMTSYSAFGVNEFAARLPSVLAGMATVLLVYALGKQMFGTTAGLLAAFVLASSLEFCILSHAATPDGVLLLFTVLTYYTFWMGALNGGRSWFVPCGIAAGLAMLTKGPVGLVMPALVIFMFFLWNGELRRFLDRRIFLGLLMFILVAAPWYILVSVETRGVWFKQFIGQENVVRFTRPMENHRGPFFYHLAGIIVFFAPWSIFLIAAAINTIRELRRREQETNEQTEARRACRFLVCWLFTYLLFFSLAATKLPNYVLPVYPALALLTARLLERWRSGNQSISTWIMPAAVICFGLVGIVLGVGLAVVSGLIPIPGAVMRLFPSLSHWVWIGLVPIAGAGVARYYLIGGNRNMVIGSVTTASILFTALLAAFVNSAFDPYKAPRDLVSQAGLQQTNRDIRLLSLQWFQPSLVFYSRREVERLNTGEDALTYLGMRHPVYLFVPEPVWETVCHDAPASKAYRTVGRKYDFQKNCDILVVTNE